MMAIKEVFFDIDGTLYPSRRFSALARRRAIRAMAREGVGVSEKRLSEGLKRAVEKYGPNYPRHFDKLLEGFGVKDSARFVAAAVRAYHAAKAGMKPYPGVGRALSELRRMGLRLYIASEGVPVKQWDKLMRLGLHRHFDGVFVCGKKSGAFYASVLRKAKVKPREALMVGDSFDKDVAPAWRARMRVAYVTHGRPGTPQVPVTRLARTGAIGASVPCLPRALKQRGMI